MKKDWQGLKTKVPIFPTSTQKFSIGKWILHSKKYYRIPYSVTEFRIETDLHCQDQFSDPLTRAMDKICTTESRQWIRSNELRAKRII